MANADAAEIRERCLNLLARREHSRAELRQKLQAKGFDGDAAAQVIAALAEQGWQSDSRFAASFIRQRLRDGYGPVRIAYELRQRGIDADADAGIDAIAAETAGSWDEILERIYADKYPDATPPTRNEWAKRVRFLQQRGFAYASIRALEKRLHLKFEV